MGYQDYFPWKDEEGVANFILKPINITIEQLRDNPRGMFYTDRPKSQRYKEKSLPTASGKVEIYSQKLKECGFDPLPTYKEPEESPLNPAIAMKYPFVLTTGAKSPYYCHGRFRNISSLRKLQPDPTVEINIDAAKKLGIEDNDEVLAESPRGSIKVRAKLTPDIDPRVVQIYHGWDDANVNMLTDDIDTACDPISGYPSFRASLCRIGKI